MVRAVSMFSWRAKSHEHFTSRAELDYMMTTIVACGNVVISHGVRYPDIAISVYINAKGPDKHLPAVSYRG